MSNMANTNAERCTEYHAIHCVEKPPKSTTQLLREFRARCKLLKSYPQFKTTKSTSECLSLTSRPPESLTAFSTRTGPQGLPKLSTCGDPKYRATAPKTNMTVIRQEGQINNNKVEAPRCNGAEQDFIEGKLTAYHIWTGANTQNTDSHHKLSQPKAYIAFKRFERKIDNNNIETTLRNGVKRDFIGNELRKLQAAGSDCSKPSVNVQEYDRVTSATVIKENTNTDQDVPLKTELSNTDLDIGLTVLQRADSFYKPNQVQQKTHGGKGDNNNNGDATLRNGVKRDFMGNELTKLQAAESGCGKPAAVHKQECSLVKSTQVIKDNTDADSRKDQHVKRDLNIGLAVFQRKDLFCKPNEVKNIVNQEKTLAPDNRPPVGHKEGQRTITQYTNTCDVDGQKRAQTLFIPVSVNCANAASNGVRRQVAYCKIDGKRLLIRPFTLLQRDINSNQIKNTVEQKNTIAQDNHPPLGNIVDDGTTTNKCDAGMQKSAQTVLVPVSVGSANVASDGESRQIAHCKINGKKLIIRPLTLMERNVNSKQDKRVIRNAENTFARDTHHPRPLEKETSVVHENRAGKVSQHPKDATSSEQHILPKVLNCDKCLRFFSCKNSFEEHYRQEHVAEKLEQTTSRRQLPLKSYLCNYTNRKGKLEYGCVVCVQTFTSRNRFCKHVTKCHRQQSTAYKKRCNDAILSEQPVQSKLISCDKCEQTFACGNSFEEHYKQKHMTELLKHLISIEEPPLESYYSNRVSHNGKLQYECIVCRKMYKSGRCFRKHLTKFHQVEIKGTREINICEKFFSPVVHYDKMWHCKVCGEVMSSKTQLRNHEKIAHNQQPTGIHSS